MHTGIISAQSLIASLCFVDQGEVCPDASTAALGPRSQPVPYVFCFYVGLPFWSLTSLVSYNSLPLFLKLKASLIETLQA